VEVLAVAPPVDGPSARAGAGCAPLACRRDAEPYESLRAASDAALARTGDRPTIFFANLGSLEDFLTPSIFAKNLFEAGGIEAFASAGFIAVQEAVTAFRHSGCRIACICASDAIAPETALATARAIGAAGAALICFAGSPANMEAALREAGVAEFVHPGCNALVILEHALARAI
jgi:methylmalonyl-CoA mutase